MKVKSFPARTAALVTLCSAVIVVVSDLPDAEARCYGDGCKYRILRRALAPERSGCTPQQVSDKDPKLESCYREQESDTQNKRRYTHYVFCTPTSRSCCQVDNATSARTNCVTIDRRVKSRGAAGPGRAAARS